VTIVNPTYDAITGDYAAQTIAYDWQVVTGALFSEGDVFYGATVTPSYTISGALFSDDDTFYAATVATSYTISGALFSEGDTFYSATVTPGQVTVSAALFTNANAFFGATVTNTAPAANDTYGQGGSHGSVGTIYDDLLGALVHVAAPIRAKSPSVREAALTVAAVVEAQQVPAPIPTDRLRNEAERLHALLNAADNHIATARAERQRQAVLAEVRRLEAIARARRAQAELVERRQREDDEIIEILLMSA
jgi:hypothetical protein